jgi:hypothetical protein
MREIIQSRAEESLQSTLGIAKKREESAASWHEFLPPRL